MTKQLKVRFVIPQNYTSEDECEPEMNQAFGHCRQYKMTASWIGERECMTINKLTKKDIFVFQNFSGPAFSRLSKMQCVIVGARCLSYCLIEGEQIPPGPHPIFTIAMRNLVVVVSGMMKEDKEAIKEKVLWMGGSYSPLLMENTTHLVSKTVISEKYMKAVETSIPVMQEKWVYAVWEASLKQNISGSSSMFSTYKLPVFANLVVTSSALSKSERTKVEKLVNKHGGIFQGQFDSNSTDVVVLNKDGVHRDKYKTAVQFNKICVLPDWVYASAEKGFCAHFKLYKVSSASTSSPISSGKTPNMTLDFSTISSIRSVELAGCINETISSASVLSVSSSKGRDDTKSSRTSRELIDDYEKLVDDISMEDIKKGGAFLDGVCAYLCGWTPSRHERLASVIFRCGGMRYDGPSERVTHIICGHPHSSNALVKQALEVAHAAIPVNVNWLIDSVKAGSPVDATSYRQNELDDKDRTLSSSSPNVVSAHPSVAGGQPSPTMKKSLQLLNGDRPPVPLFRIEENVPDELDDVMIQYINQANKVGESEDTLMQELQQGANFDAHEKSVTADHRTAVKISDEGTSLAQTKSDQDNTTAQNSEFSETSEEILDIFNDIRFEFQGIEDEVRNEYSSSIIAYRGIVVKPGHGGSYVVVPFDFDDNDVVNKYAEVVTTLWLDDCIIRKELLPIQYYHRPVRILQYVTPLKGLVLGISTYTGVERSFIDEVAKLLGATTQLTFCRRTTTDNLASTHLICPESTGAKYKAAVRWGLPSVSVEWLLSCIAVGKRVREAPYLIGETKEPEWEEEREESTLNSTHNTSNKENENTIAEVAEHKDCTVKEITATEKENTSLNRTASTENTPHRKVPLKLSFVDGGELSPASRYIAMARQGLLGADTQDTPKRQNEPRGNSEKRGSVEGVLTTPTVEDVFSTPNLAKFSPTSKRRLLAIKKGEIPSDPLKTPRNPFDISMATPESPFGAGLMQGAKRMSPESRKWLWKEINGLPEKQPDIPQSNTPLNELMDRFANRHNSADSEIPVSRKLEIDDDTEMPLPKQMKIDEDKISSGVDTQLRHLTSVLMGGSVMNSSGNGSAPTTPQGVTPRRRLVTNSAAASIQCLDNLDNAVKLTCDSQADTVGWEDLSESAFKKQQTVAVPQIRRFMISSNVDNREEISAMIEKLGGEVSQCLELDSSATHLLCSKPGRSEKVLGSIASRKWVLHPAYIVRSHEQGKFINENGYEWGNPEAVGLPSLTDSERQLAAAVHRWHSSAVPPYSNFKIVLHVMESRHEQLCRLIEAGGGKVLEVSPPYACAEATHCFVEKRNRPLEQRDLEFFASNGIPVCLPVFLNNYLVQDPSPSAIQSVVSEYKALLNRME